MASPQIFVDDISIFPTVARNIDAMLMPVEPQNLLLVQYFDSIDCSVSIGVFPLKGVEGSPKYSKLTKKKKKAEKPPTVVEEVMKEFIT